MPEATGRSKVPRPPGLCKYHGGWCWFDADTFGAVRTTVQFAAALRPSPEFFYVFLTGVAGVTCSRNNAQVFWRSPSWCSESLLRLDSTKALLVSGQEGLAAKESMRHQISSHQFQRRDGSLINISAFDPIELGQSPSNALREADHLAWENQDFWRQFYLQQWVFDTLESLESLEVHFPDAMTILGNTSAVMVPGWRLLAQIEALCCRGKSGIGLGV